MNRSIVPPWCPVARSLDRLGDPCRYSERPPRYEYLLTAAGRDARSISVALLAWGNRHLAPEGESIVVMNTETGKQADPIMVDRITGKPITDPVFRLAAGPAAPLAAHRRVETRNQRMASAVS